MTGRNHPSKLDRADAQRTVTRHGVTFQLRRSRRKTVGLAIHRDGSVHVTAPLRTPLRTIEAILDEKAAWIERKQREIQTLRPPSPPKTYIDGEAHLYLGRARPLSLRVGEQEGVALQDETLMVTTRDPSDGERVRILLRRWYRREAGRVLAERFEAHRPLADRLGVRQPHLVLRDMTRSWGNCRPNGRITLNRDLIRAPIACIDSVIAHEYCHLREPNHSKAFYALWAEASPDWRALKGELERILA